METKYTQGPWTVDPSEARAMSGERIFKVIADRPYGGLIADVSAWWVDTESARNNSRLIAAAPDLLAALEMASRIIAKGGSITGSQIEIIDSALAKAKGDA